MQIELKYGKDILRIEIPDRHYRGTILPREAEGVPDPEGEVRSVLDRPIWSAKLRDIVNQSDNVVILASDISRPAPSAVLLPPLVQELNQAGINDDRINIIFGLGVHRPQTEQERINLIGEELYRRIPCRDHDINDCVEVGITARGTRAEVFRPVVEADRVIATGNLEFHYFAGYSGGAKALAPGVCSRKTIESNHSLFLHPDAAGGKIDGNPLREELEEIAAMVGIDFMVNALLNHKKQIVKVVAGDVIIAHREGAAEVDRIFRVPAEEAADIVIVSPGGYPKDMNLYQSHKSMQNALHVLKKGGILIVAAKCSEGIGEANFEQALTAGLSRRELIDELGKRFVQGRHIASQIARIQTDYRLFLVSDMPRSITDRMFFPCYTSVGEALAVALAEKGSGGGVVVIPHGISTLPWVVHK